MRISLRSLLILTLVLAIGIAGWVSLANSNRKAWASGTSQNSVVDNPGYSILAQETEKLLALKGFVPSSMPKSSDDFRSLQGKWFRSAQHPEVNVFIYHDLRSYTADVCVSVTGSMKNVPTLKRYTEQLVSEVRNLWDPSKHQLQDPHTPPHP